MLPPLPNVLPTLAAGAPYRLALLLPWPSEDDCRIGKPLTGSAGYLLRGMMAAVGIKLDAEVAVCHLSQHWRATWEAGGWEGEQVQYGIAQLAADLAAWQPNLLLGLDDPRLGAGVLHLLRHGNVAPHRTPSGYQWPSKLGKWRGSLFNSADFSAASTVPTSPLATEGSSGQVTAVGGVAARSFKSMTTYHPSYLLSVWSKTFEARQDLRRARDEARTPQLNLPPTNLSYGPVE